MSYSYNVSSSGFNSSGRPVEGVLEMLQKDPVELNESVVEVKGTELDYETLRFWSDTFRYTDLLRHQSGDLGYIPDNTPETTTFEIQLTVDSIPEFVLELYENGDRFALYVENEYLDLDVDSARVEKADGGEIVIVANVEWRAMINVC